MIQLEMRYDDTMYEVKLVQKKPNGNIKIELQLKNGEKKDGIFKRIFKRRMVHSNTGRGLHVIPVPEQTENHGTNRTETAGKTTTENRETGSEMFETHQESTSGQCET